MLEMGRVMNENEALPVVNRNTLRNFLIDFQLRTIDVSDQVYFVFQSKCSTEDNHCNEWSDISY